MTAAFEPAAPYELTSAAQIGASHCLKLIDIAIRSLKSAGILGFQSL